MTAHEIAAKSYNKFEDKKEITELLTTLFCVESDHSIRVDGFKIKGEFDADVFNAIAESMRNEFVLNRRCSCGIKELCVEIIEKMNY